MIQNTCHSDSNCVDIGAYRGEILKAFLQYCPEGQIFAFEPVSENASFLRNNFPKVQVFNTAVAANTGTRDFFVPTGRPARSGLLRQPYPNPEEKVEIIRVNVDLLDNLIDINTPINFIKIDVEGAELDVLHGAVNILQTYQPEIYLSTHGARIHAECCQFLRELGYVSDEQCLLSRFPGRRSTCRPGRGAQQRGPILRPSQAHTGV